VIRAIQDYRLLQKHLMPGLKWMATRFNCCDAVGAWMKGDIHQNRMDMAPFAVGLTAADAQFLLLESPAELKGLLQMIASKERISSSQWTLLWENANPSI
jgi:hypothetical protein